jgi:hypothetical protein
MVKVQWKFNHSHLRPKAGYLIGGKCAAGWPWQMVTKVAWMKALDKKIKKNKRERERKKACTW